ncbi:hypothetical protein LLG96_15970 [bacterium]|nr:hypothetical protein [bacterium]
MYPALIKGIVWTVSVMLPVVIIFGMVACSQDPGVIKPAPANSNQALLNALKGRSQPVVLGSENGPQIIITPELSARVLGAAIKGAADENLMWVNTAVLDGSIWEKKPLNWNAGGLRSWLAPEDLFFVDANQDPGTWFVPSALDPVTFRVIEQSAQNASFEADMDIPANTGQVYKITFRRSIELLTTPPAEAGALPAGVEFLGIRKTHSITNRSDEVIGEQLPFVCLWSLLQLNPSGTMLIPLREGADPKTAYREYFNPLGDRLVVQNNIISVKIDGKYRSKIGVRPEAAGKGEAFLRDNRDGTGILYAKVFSVDPSGKYVDKPWGKPSAYGDAVEMYNDDGKSGGFCEVECHSPAKKLVKGDTQTYSLDLLIFRGPIGELKNIGSKLYDVDLNGAYYF